MKYYLALDGSYGSVVEYKRLDLSSISPKLMENDNLRTLIEFTTTFKSESELREFLVSKKICELPSNRMKIAIIYSKGNVFNLRVPYLKDKKYLDKTFINELIKERISENLIILLIKRYYHNKKALYSLYDLKEAFCSHRPKYEIEVSIKDFLDNLLYDPKTKKIKYRWLYDIAMLMALYNAKYEIEEKREEQVPDGEKSNPAEEYEQMRLY